MISLGLTASAFGQVSETAQLWREWMSVYSREASQTNGARLYLMTEREILQTSASAAKFQSGRYRIVLADGSVPDVDGDLDGYTDEYEFDNEANRNDPDSIPQTGTPPEPLPTDAFSILLANGASIGISDIELTPYYNQAGLVRPNTGANVRVVAAPASKMQRPVALTDYSGLFYYFFGIPGQTIGEYQEYPLSLYQLEKNYPNPGDAGTFEASMVPGVYMVEFPTIANPPYGKATASVAHRLLPNGSLTVGLKKPTWLIKTLASTVSATKVPVNQSWVNGKLKFDPYLPMTITWDSLTTQGFANLNDYIEVWIENESGLQISYTFRMRANTSSFATDNSAAMKLIYGDFASFLGKSSPPLTVNGHIVMKFYRYANRQSSADISTVTVRTPVEMTVTYTSWRKNWFPSNPETDSISGPSADPDRDGVTNQQEFDQGSNPTAARFLVSNPTSANIGTNSATLGGKLISDPYSNVQIIEQGVVYSATSTNASPLIDGPGVNKAVAPLPVSLNGVFTTDVSGLNAQTQYSFRAYAITDLGTYYTNPVSTFTTLNITLPIVISPTSSDLTLNSAILGGNVTSDGGAPLTEKGVVFSISSTNSNPLIGGIGVTQLPDTTIIGLFTIDATDLLMNTAYSFKAYATNSLGTSYTNIGTFTTLRPVSNIESPTSTSITATSATLGGTVIADALITDTYERGVVYSPTSINSIPRIDGLGVNRAVSPAPTGTPTFPALFTVAVTGLSANTAYSFCAYTITNLGIFYTVPISSFTTLPLPPVTLPSVTSPTSSDLKATSAKLGGTVTSDGNSPITERGVVYSKTNDNPFVDGTAVTKLTSPGTTGPFTVSVTGLTAGTVYYFRAYATNSVGRSHTTNIGTFTTPSAPTITTPTSTNVTSTTATLGGNVTQTGGVDVTQRGVVFSPTNINPTRGASGVTDFTAISTGLGVFTVNVNSLIPGRTYSFKAYAINSVSTSYTTVGTFTTPGTLPTITTPTLTSITATSATLGANVSDNGSSPITERGFIYSKTSENSNPIVGGTGVTKISLTGTTGVMTSPITGLNANTGYMFKAYAINGIGTAYTVPNSFFTTLPPLTVNSPTFANITATTATLGGTVVSDGGTTVSERGVVYSAAPNTAPVIGGSGVVKVIGTGTMGTFTVEATGLLSDQLYYFSAYATNTAGTSYSEVSSFTTEQLLLLGMAQVQWVPTAQAPAASSITGVSNVNPAPTNTVLQFTYQKTEDDIINNLLLKIEVSSNFKNWLEIDGNPSWSVSETNQTLSARWNSVTAPAERTFFRVKGTTRPPSAVK